MKKLLLLSVALLPLSACSSLVGESLFTSDHEGRFLLSADSAGLQEFGKSLNGLVVTGKASPDMQDAYFANQAAETEVKKFRLTFKNKGEK